MPAHLHPSPQCTEKLGRPCPTHPGLCAHSACRNGGNLLGCEKTVEGKYYCFHSEYYLGSDVLPDAYKPNFATYKLPPYPLPPQITSLTNAPLTPKQRALALVQEFEQRTGRGAFPNIAREAVASDLRARIEDPASQDQAHSSFCGPAAFMFCYLDDPVAYTKYVTELYDNGQVHIGSMLIRPSSGFRFDPLPWDIHSADWIALGSLRDSENWFFEYHRAELPFLKVQADIDMVEAMRGGTSTSDALRWFNQAGYTRVEDWTGEDMLMSKARLASDYYKKNYRVCLLICANMLLAKPQDRDKSGSADHFVVLTSPITVGDDQVSFMIYTWANKNWAVKVKAKQFWKHFYGFIAAGR